MMADISIYHITATLIGVGGWVVTFSEVNPLTGGGEPQKFDTIWPYWRTFPHFPETIVRRYRVSPGLAWPMQTLQTHILSLSIFLDPQTRWAGVQMPRRRTEKAAHHFHWKRE